MGKDTNITSRTIMGIIIVVIAILILFQSFINFLEFIGPWYYLIYGIPLLIIGLYILFNRKEDEIEQVRRRKK